MPDPPPLMAALVVLLVLATASLFLSRNLYGGAAKDGFWTQYSGAVPTCQQVRRVDAAEKGVPDEAWALAYLPPNYCTNLTC